MMDRLKADGPKLTSTGYLSQRAIQRRLADLIRDASPSPRETVLDLGCGNRPYQWMIPEVRWVGINPVTDGAEPDLLGDALALPFKDASLDGVLATQVLEHVRRPWVALEEISRCLRPGGWCILTVPMSWRLHEEPWDFWRFTRYGLRGIAEDAGLEVVRIDEDLGTLPSVLNSFQHVLVGPVWAPVRLGLNLLGAVAGRFSRTSHYSTNLSCLLRRPR